MFLTNKYTKLYYKIIQNAKINGRIKRRSTHKSYVYYENHHIIPKSLGGSDENNNLVLLTAREHFLCHYLLCKMLNEGSYGWKKVVRAFTCMYSSSSSQKRYVNTRLYERARKNIGIIMSESQTGKGNSQYGTIWMSNIKERHCCKVKPEEIETYLENGYIKKRIVSWKSYDKKINENKKKEKLLLEKKLDNINKKIKKLEEQKKIIELEISQIYISIQLPLS
jgi:hypothetical protein